jgi:hypothetical protein
VMLVRDGIRCQVDDRLWLPRLCLTAIWIGFSVRTPSRCHHPLAEFLSTSAVEGGLPPIGKGHGTRNDELRAHDWVFNLQEVAAGSESGKEGSDWGRGGRWALRERFGLRDGLESAATGVVIGELPAKESSHRESTVLESPCASSYGAERVERQRDISATKSGTLGTLKNSLFSPRRRHINVNAKNVLLWAYPNPFSNSEHLWLKPFYHSVQ